MNITQLEDEYLEEKKRYDEGLEELLYYKQQGIRAIDDLADRSSFYLREFETEEVNLTKMYHYLEQEKSDFELQVKREENKLVTKIEELEFDYKKARQLQEEKEEEET